MRVPQITRTSKNSVENFGSEKVILSEIQMAHCHEGIVFGFGNSVFVSSTSGKTFWKKGIFS